VIEGAAALIMIWGYGFPNCLTGIATSLLFASGQKNLAILIPLLLQVAKNHECHFKSIP
jgi:hypothetical protein